ncbi:MAG TPA: TIGR03118 family protein [Gemmatimonadales bacterium]|jgi:uncharacterized protein (TIGR03118 family)
MKRTLLLVVAGMVAACSPDATTTSPDPAAAAAAAAKHDPKDATKEFALTALVSDVHRYHGNVLDHNLVNPWGLAFNPSGILWVANNGSGKATLYNEQGAVQSLVVTVPGAGGTTGVPTGMVFNATTDFVIPSSTAAKFIIAGEDGTIAAWSGGTSAVIVADRSAMGTVYKGIAIAANGGANQLYLSDFHNGKIDVFDASYHFVSSFTDPQIPATFGPFGIHAIDGKLWVTFAKKLAPDNHDDQPGLGNGYVDVFNPDGTLAQRFAAQGTLNSPWGVVVAPGSFGGFAGDVLVGNFGDGHIGAYDMSSGAFEGFLRGDNHQTLEIDGLWDMTFGPESGASTLFFSAGPDGESHGVLGTLTKGQ